MKTSNYLIALAALSSFTFVSCSDNDFLGSASNMFSGAKEEITFGSGTKNLTRAGENLQHAKAAEKLNNHFVLYGFKYNPSEDAAAANDKLVFDHYNLYYQEGTENTTESNTAGWEYVGYQTTASQDQSIKYWDHSAAGYVFSAISSLDATATKITTGTTVYDKGWTVSIPAGGTLNGLYASDRVEKLLAKDYDKEVMLTFYSVVTKVRFAFYEIIPGYRVHIDKFYYGSTGTTTNFAIDGDFRGLNPEDETELTVTYYSNTDVDGIENRPKISYSESGVNKETSKTFGTNIQATAAIGTSSPEATYDQYGGEYTCILPYKSGNLSLKVDYTLTSIDGSGETIEVKGATAVVPNIYTNWKENFAYTYLFKISDNSNGYTGPDGVRGLYPITFDACVVNEEDGIQETITSIAEPSFTTYQNGVIVTENDEYIEGKVADKNTNIYYTVMLNGEAQALNANTQVYEVNNYGTETLTENVVENWKNNYCVLTAVPSTKATEIPMKNGAKLSPTGETAYYFTPKAGKNYVIQYKVPANIAYTDLDEYKAMTGNSTATAIPTGQYKVKAGDYYKLIRVVGDPAPITYTLTAATASENITTQTGTTTYTLKSTSPAANTAVLGAADIFQIKKGTEDATAKFDITDNENGTYTIKATADAIKVGLDGTYSVAVVKKDGTVGSAATIDDADNTFAVDMASSLAATVVAGNKVEITPSIGGASVSGAAITDISNSKITIVEKAGEAGTYVISAASDLVAGTGYSAKIAGEKITITVNSYAFAPTAYTFEWYEGAAAGTHDITLSDASGLAAIALADIKPTVAGIVTVDKKNTSIDGNYTLTAAAGGKTTLKYENATLDVTVNKYALVCEGAAADTKQITALTGSAKLIYTLNDKEQVVKTSDIEVTWSSDGSSYGSASGKTYSLVNNGKYFTFGNVVTPGYYKFEYKKGSDVVGSEIIQVK